MTMEKERNVTMMSYLNLEKNRNTCSLVVALWPVGCLVRTGTGAGTAVQVLAAEYGHF